MIEAAGTDLLVNEFDFGATFLAPKIDDLLSKLAVSRASSRFG
jgi:hypothetical protein